MLVTLMTLSLIGFTQTCYTPPTGGVYVTLDSSYLLGTVAEGNTKVGLCFYNSTTSKITATQFRVYYDTLAFSSVDTVTSIDTSFSQYLKYVNGHGYVTITFTYTGNLSTFGLANGGFVKIQLHHTTGYAALSTVDSMSFIGSPTYPNLATTQLGMDTAMNLYNFGGAFNSRTMSYHGTFVNVTGSKAKSLTLALDKKLRTGSTWTQVTTRVTDTSGRFAFTSISIDTTGYDVRLNIQGDTMAVGNVISVSDAQRVNQYVIGTATPSGFDYYSSDANGDNNISISDVYGVFGRVSGRFTTWPNSVKDIKFFTQSQYATINGSSTNYTSTIGGSTNFTFNIIAGQPDSVTYYVLIPGDANNTGYHMARLTPIEIVNPDNARNNIIDVTTKYDDNKEMIELNYPDLSIEELNKVIVPVKVKSNDIKLGSLQLAMKYDENLLEFKGLFAESSVSSWVSFLNPNSGIIQWGGYDPSDNTHLLSNNELAFTLQFNAKKILSEWNASPLYVTEKYAGDINAIDLNIIPTNSIVRVYKSSRNLLVNGENMKIYPNPTNGYVTIAFKVTKQGQNTLGIYDITGTEKTLVMNDILDKGEYLYNTSLENLPAGEYIAVLKNIEGQFSKKVVKY